MIGDILVKDISINVGITTADHWDNGGQTCALDVSSIYLVTLVQCIMPVTGRFLTIFPQSSNSLDGIEICDLRVYGQGKNDVSYCNGNKPIILYHLILSCLY